MIRTSSYVLALLGLLLVGTSCLEATDEPGAPESTLPEEGVLGSLGGGGNEVDESATKPEVILAGTCKTSACNYQSPIDTHCDDDAYTVYNPTPMASSNGTIYGYVHLRYSPSCNANWARVYVTNSAVLGDNVHVYLQQWNYGDRTWHDGVPPYVPYYFWTGMFEGTFDMRACAYSWVNGTTLASGCTGWG